MKHIYSKVYSAALMLALMLTTGCSDELTNHTDPSQSPTTGQPLTITATQGTKRVQTRLGYEEQADGTVSVTWAAEDKIRMTQAPAADQSATLYAPFALTTGKGETSATFTEEGSESSHWTENAPLYATYGRQEKIIVTNQTNTIYASCTYTGQTQTANEDNSHIAGYDFMYAKGENTRPVLSDFNFVHAGALMKFTLTLPEEAKSKKANKLELRTEDGTESFVSILHVAFEGSANKLGATNNISLQLGNGSEGVTLNNGKLTAYMMVAPTAGAPSPLQGKNILLNVYTTDGICYSTTLTGSPIETEQFYTVEETLTKVTMKVDVTAGNLTTILKSLTPEAGATELKLVGTLKNTDLERSGECLNSSYTIQSSVLSNWLRSIGTSITTLDLSEVTGLTEIPKSAFYGCGKSALGNSAITRIILPENGITSIGENAFQFCNIQTFNIPSSVTAIGASAFHSSKLSYLIIPAGVTNISNLALNTLSLKKIIFEGEETIPANINIFTNDEYISDITFYLPKVIDQQKAAGVQQACKYLYQFDYTKTYAPAIYYGWNPSTGIDYATATDAQKMDAANYTNEIKAIRG